MKIVIVGAGFTGMQLARTLVAEDNAVVLIDNDAERVRHAGDQLDCLVVQAEGNNLDALEEAGVASADALVTLTEDDEINMITCSLVDAVYPEILKIARVRNYAYYMGAAATSRRHAAAFSGGRRPLFGIDRMLHPDVEAAAAIGRAMAHGAIGDVTGLGGGFGITNLPVGAGSPLDGIALRGLAALEDWRYLVAYVETASGASLPSGDTVLHAGDHIGVISRTAEIHALPDFVAAESERFDRIAVFGAGRIGSLVLDSRLNGRRSLWRERLLGKGGGGRLLLVDSDPRRCREAAEAYPGARVLCGDVLDDDLIGEEDIGSCDLLVAASDNYERNLIAAAYLKSRGVSKTIALTADSAFGGIARKLGIDVSVPVRDTLVDSIMSHLRGKNVKAVHTVCNRQFEIVECDVSERSAAAGKTLREFASPGDYLVLLVRAPEGGESVVPHGDTVLQAGAHIVVITRAGDSRILRKFGEDR